jgi:hypothetical protein
VYRQTLLLAFSRIADILRRSTRPSCRRGDRRVTASGRRSNRSGHYAAGRGASSGPGRTAALRASAARLRESTVSGHRPPVRGDGWGLQAWVEALASTKVDDARDDAPRRIPRYARPTETVGIMRGPACREKRSNSGAARAVVVVVVASSSSCSASPASSARAPGSPRPPSQDTAVGQGRGGTPRRRRDRSSGRRGPHRRSERLPHGARSVTPLNIVW